ncbi:olfactory receptor 52P1-like [Emydura macquarii macquarii]|uniref:olfactory receptor 52P1-like n=1 Tax=Emydura macquarii macquarii TaxID=1129001 RepID=UPI00352BB3BC
MKVQEDEQRLQSFWLHKATLLELCAELSPALKRMNTHLRPALTIKETDQCFDPLNVTSSNPSTFILNGIPGLEAAHIWISIPFSMFYLITLLGYFTALCIFWFGFKGITVDGCLTQLFFLYLFATTHSAVLMIMAFDHYIAICDPLRYATILTIVRIAKLGFVALIRAAFLILPMSLLLRRLPFCANRVILHTYCEHLAVVKMSCGDTRINQMYGLVSALVIIGLNLTLIGLSYRLNIRAVLRNSSKKVHQNALNTCTAHICVMLMTYTPYLFTALTNGFGQGIAAHVHILLANLYLLVPPMLNPIIYGVKTKELHEKVGKYTCRM